MLDHIRLLLALLVYHTLSALFLLGAGGSVSHIILAWVAFSVGLFLLGLASAWEDRKLVQVS